RKTSSKLLEEMATSSLHFTSSQHKDTKCKRQHFPSALAGKSLEEDCSYQPSQDHLIREEWLSRKGC
uniref:Uncharacterized protein n=1 Tax=Chlorocebus sabaeus TaxID=60711 RepID=A0A0D9SB55_CHLSB